MQRSYEKRRQSFFSALNEHLSEELSFQQPKGGLALWAKVEGGISALEWSKRGLDAGVMVQPAAHLFFDGRDHPYLRLGFARLEEDELVDAIARLKRAHPNASFRRRSRKNC
jgi:GntR family transcriptional regulator/MocR family aminotransferase